MALILRDVTRANWQECVRLTLAPEQEPFVQPNLYSLAESKFNPTYVPQAIYVVDDVTGVETMVGFIMYGLFPDGEPPFGQRHWIFRLMVAHAHQGRGYGTAALNIVLDRLRADPTCPDVLIGHVPANTIAEKLYLRLGFTPFGAAPWGETVLIRETPSPD